MQSCGIDFGTSNTLAAVAGQDGVSACVLDPLNGDPILLPSLLYFSRYGWNRVGRAATRANQAEPEDGRFIRALKAALPDYEPSDTFRIWQETYSLPGLVRLVLGRVRERLGAEFGPISHATIGRPVRFSADADIDRRAEGILRSAAEAAGFRSVRFLSEPEAATRHYFSGERPREATVLVFDFGGGTLDLCLARFTGDRYQVLGTSGAAIGGTLLDRILFERKLLPHLGQGQKWGRGLTLPHSIFNRLVNPDAAWRISEREYALEVRRILNMSAAGGTASRPLRNFQTVVSRRLGPDLFGAIEEAKMRLSSQEEAEIRFYAADVRIEEPLSRADLRFLFREQMDAIRALISTTLSAAALSPRDVDRVLLAGGSSALICVQELLGELFGPEKVPLRHDLFTSIVSGLALDAGDLLAGDVPREAMLARSGVG